MFWSSSRRNNKQKRADRRIDEVASGYKNGINKRNVRHEYCRSLHKVGENNHTIIYSGGQQI